LRSRANERLLKYSATMMLSRATTVPTAVKMVQMSGWTTT